ncbi:MAG TPA: cupredoxin domain-containing protein [Candidatus Limnocylindrales bacterium]|nr:cupredoxin domain-containing protein [Candidatus Limnocylindrales bacterium]
MRRLPFLTLPLATAFAAVVLAACSSGSAPGWTYAPAASASAAASGAAQGSPGASPSAVASETASASPSDEASGSPAASGGEELTVKADVGAATAGFDPTTLEAPANTAFTLKFENEDNQAQHNLVLQNADGSNVAVTGDTSIFQGPGDREYQVPGLAAGTYGYICQVHPSTMKGSLTVK